MNKNDANLQDALKKFLTAESLKRLRIACILGMTLVPFGSLLDFFVYPDYLIHFFWARLICSAVITIILLISYSPFGGKYSNFLGIIFTIVIGIAIVYMIQQTGGYLSPYYAGLNLVLLAVGTLLPWGFKETLVSGLSIYLTYLFPILFTDQIADIGVFVNNNYFLLLTIVIALTGNHFSSKLRNREFLLRLNLEESTKDLELSNQKLLEMDALKTKFFANISHELRTPLTLILAPTEMMLSRALGDLTADQERYLEIMQTNMVRLLKLINTLLDLAKLDAGKMEVYYHRTDFIKFVSGVVKSVSPMAEKKSLVLNFQGDSSLPEMFFDPDKIEKVVLNLVFNALKFTDVGEVRVSCVKDDDQVLIKVSDTGIGIPKEHMSKLFSRFSQADGSASRKYEGTGIGLALAKELVELHHGKIWAESEEGRGTTFIFTLPIYTRLEDVPGALDRRREALPVGEDRRKEDWSKSVLKVDPAAVGIVRRDSFPKEERTADDLRHRILIVDDNPDMLSHIAMQLKDDYQLLYAKDGREGVDRAMSEIPHLIISDVMMPYKDGHQLCKEVKENPRTCHIPVILLTARTDLSNKIEGLERGADDYLTKPFNSQELKARVRSLLNLRRLEREIQLRSQELEVTLKELKETQGQLVQSEKMAALGLLVAGVAHEINNPISFAKGSVGTVKRALEEMKTLKEKGPVEAAELFEDIRESVDIIKNGLERTETIVHNLKSFVRKDEEFFKQFDIHAGLDSTLQLFQHDLTYKIKVNRDFGKVEPIEAIPGQLNQAFMNIIQNAIHAINGKGEIYIKTEQSGNQVTISIRDTGCGIAEKDLPRIFDPFFTTKEVGKGTGLGMTITYKIIERHHGKLEIKSQVGSGTEVRIMIPASQSDKNQRVEGGLYAGSAPV